MISFKHFIKQLPLVEALDAYQKNRVDDWTPPTNDHLNFSDKAMNNQDKISIPLEHPELKSEHADTIHNHLAPHGYTPHDYKNGLVKDKYGRETKIGSALIKTKASPDMLHSFNTDPARTAAKKTGMHVVISRNPHDVAGMSTNRNWPSCMNMDGGVYHDKLKHDIKHGTHVAYLTHEDDTDINHPIARIAIKPHIHDQTGDKILRPEGSSYGNSNDAFKHTVRKWAEENFPAKHPIYTKQQDLYNDDRNTHAVSNDPKHIDELVNHGDAGVRKIAAQSPHLQDHHVEQLLNDRSNETRHAAASNPNLKPHHVDKILDNPVRYGHEMQYAISKNPALKDHHIDKILDDSDGSNLVNLAQNPSLKDHHIDRLLKNKSLSVSRHLSKHPKLKDGHIDQILSGKINHYPDIAGHPNLKSHHLDRLIDGIGTVNGDDVNQNIVNHKKLKDHHVERLMNATLDKHEKKSLAKNPRLSEEKYEKFLNHNDSSYRHGALQSVKLKEHHIDKLIDNIDNNPNGETIASALADHKNIKPHHIDKLLDSKRKALHYELLNRTDLTPEHIDKLINNGSIDIRGELASRSNLTSDHIDKLVKDKSPHVQEQMAMRHDLTSDHIHTLIDNNHEYVDSAISNHPNLTPEHINKLISSKKSADTIERMAGHSGLTPEHLDKLTDHDQHPSVISKVAAHHMLDSHHIDKLISNPKLSERAAYRLMENDQAIMPHLDKVVNSNNTLLQQKHIESTNHLSDEHFDKYLNNTNATIKHALAKNRRLKPEQIDKLLDKNDPATNMVISKRYALSDHHANRLLDNMKSSRHNAVHHANIIAGLMNSSQKHSKDLLNHKDENISKIAKDVLSKKEKIDF